MELSLHLFHFFYMEGAVSLSEDEKTPTQVLMYHRFYI